ncbi:MAG TPA: YciI family protein [Acidimicrobiia bacterium]|nr:YciI family protein [Acidimicrobiia bacterium]
MTQYMLSVFDGAGEEELPTETIEQIYADVDALNEEIMAAGAWVFGGGLHPADTATVVSVKDDDTLVTDGPFAETKEHIGGFWIIEAPDLDAALEWAGKATRACRGPVEVRPFQDEPEA